METIGIGTLIAVIGCAVGAAGWLSGRDRRFGDDGHWRGTVDAKLDDIKMSVNGTSAEILKINEAIRLLGERLTAVEQSSKQAHRRLDELTGRKRNPK